MFTIDEFPGRELKINGKDYLYFGGTSYLGLQTDTKFQSLFIENIKKYGTTYSASRKSNIRISIFDESELYLSKLVGSEACITMSSGYLAGQLVCDFFNHTDYQLYYAPNTHSALFRGQQKVYTNWKELKNDIKKNQGKNHIVFLDSIDFNGNNYPNFKPLQDLPLKDIILIIDDSHGIGITGDNGGGSYSFIKSLKPKELLVSSSLGKGFGIQAGAIFGAKHRIEKFKETQFYGGSSPATPASLATILDAQYLTADKRALLNRNTALFLTNLSDPSLFLTTKSHPTFSFQNETLTMQLEEKGILVTNFRYPTKDDTLMSRIVISASHTTEDIITLCNILNSLSF
ncbi:pyridoxal phosphate-dependent aminotransferase family protein [Maribacter sp. ACAM166]|uniref:pyridoxal phosphate-dependent aminotransferase family protein n=1 Tax=Maribacter sp. ACAM166 TaxID=2508996 RepID=UPI0010FD32BD|nr:pyridoxal phosphate-dependent aminotransferase family protein [Maribacter sp. ACAM166]TLP80286.1 pyridoxal phosphate-dependent aminotransferase family protein [Maribacter sp. ACAM166]